MKTINVIIIYVIIAFASLFLWVFESSPHYGGLQKYTVKCTSQELTNNFRAILKENESYLYVPWKKRNPIDTTSLVIKYDTVEGLAENRHLYHSHSYDEINNKTYLGKVVDTTFHVSYLYFPDVDAYIGFLYPGFQDTVEFTVNEICIRKGDNIIGGQIFISGLSVFDILRVEHSFEKNILSRLGPYEKHWFQGIRNWYAYWFFCNQLFITSLFVLLIVIYDICRTRFKQKKPITVRTRYVAALCLSVFLLMSHNSFHRIHWFPDYSSVILLAMCAGCVVFNFVKKIIVKKINVNQQNIDNQ